jgi:hypothetical protein
MPVPPRKGYRRPETSPPTASAPPAQDAVGRPEKLVTIESQREFDILAGRWEERVFVKMYVAARTSGLLGAISDRDWKTLCALATYMDADGYCFPSQEALAKAIGCSRQMANERIGSLASFRFNDKPVLLVVKGERAENGRWSRNGYHVLPIAGLAIFDDDRKAGALKEQPGSAVPEKPKRRAVSRKLDTGFSELTVSSFLDTVKETPTVSSAVSSDTGPVRPDTNKTQISNQPEQDLSNYRSPSSRGRHFDVAPRDRETVSWYISNFAEEFSDNAPLGSSVSRALNLYKRSGLSLDEFLHCLQDARRITKAHWAAIRGERRPGRPKSAMRYYFAVAEDVLGLGGGTSTQPAGSKEDA